MGARSGANFPAGLPVAHCPNADSATSSSSTVLRRFPHAALWRSPRPGLFGFVCDISLTLPDSKSDSGTKSCFDSAYLLHGPCQLVRRKLLFLFGMAAVPGPEVGPLCP